VKCVLDGQASGGSGEKSRRPPLAFPKLLLLFIAMLSVLRKRAADSLLRAYSTRASQIVFGEVRDSLSRGNLTRHRIGTCVVNLDRSAAVYLPLSVSPSLCLSVSLSLCLSLPPSPSLTSSPSHPISIGREDPPARIGCRQRPDDLGRVGKGQLQLYDRA
jgi:hypothetical protein